MARVRVTKHGVYCSRCNEVYSGTEECEHSLSDKSGIQKTSDGYRTSAEDMGHYGPHQWIEVDGLDMCAECGIVKLPVEMVE